MGCYSHVLTRWPHFILCAVILLVIGCALVALIIIPFPRFNDPILGFEARGTKIKGQEQVILKLDMPETNGLSFIAPAPFKEEVISSPYVMWTYVNFIQSALNITMGRPPRGDTEEVTTVHDPQEELEGCDDIAFNPTAPKIVFTSKNDDTLLTEESVRAMCSLEKKLTNILEPKACSHRQSITYYMEGMSGKPCEELSQHDIITLLDILHTCMPYYESGQLKELCDNSTCVNIPVECRANKTVYNIIYFLSDSQFFHRDVNQVKYKEKLSYAILAVTNLKDYKSYYRSYIENDALIEGNVFVKAVDSRVKFELFNDFLLEDMVLFAVAMVLILVSMCLYLRSFIVTLATVLNVVFTLLISYTIYHIVLNINHFPFINLLTGLICIAISADDVFIFYDTWQQIKSEYPDATLPQWMSKTLSHAALSIFVTSLTTASAFFSNVVSEITDIKCFGIFSGVAIMCNFALMITWIPCVVALLEKYSRNCCPQKGCSCYEKFNQYISKINVVFERFLPSVVVNTWFIWLILLFLLGVGGIVVVFIAPRLELPTSREFQVFQSSDPMEVWDLETKKHFRYMEHDKNDVTTQRLPVAIVWGLKGSDNGNHLDPSDSGSLEFDSSFNMSSPEAQTWMENICRHVKNSSWVDPSMKRVPCTISVFNAMMRLPCADPGLSPCCGYMSSPPFPEDIFSNCFPKIISVFQLILQNQYGELPDIFTLGTPVYSNKGPENGSMVGYVLTAMGSQAWSPILGQMETYLTTLETFLDESRISAPRGVEKCWITSGFKFYDLQRALSSGTYVAIGVSVAVAFLVMLLTTLNFFITLYALFTIIMSISVTVGALVLLGWKLNILESITISLAVGLSIDFSIHYGVAYRLSKSTNRQKKVRESFLRVGSSVAMAAFTTFIAGVAMMPAKVLAYVQLGIFLMLVMTISWSYATFFFQSLCRIIGPKKTAYSFKCCQRKVIKETEERVPNGWDPDHTSQVLQGSYSTSAPKSEEKEANGIVLQETNRTISHKPTDDHGDNVSHGYM